MSRTGPMRFGVPWTELVENGQAEPTSVEFVGKSVVIEGLFWYILIDGHYWSNRKRTANGYLVSHGGESLWHIEKTETGWILRRSDRDGHENL